MKIDMEAPVAEALRAAGDASRLREYAAVAGGDINQAARLCTGHGTYLLKWGVRGKPGFYGAEAHGLALLADALAVRVPQVLAWSDTPTGGFILLEWIESPRDAGRQAAAAALGRSLAQLHRASAHAYGLDRDNYIGASPQPNGWLPGWIDFFRERRLGFQAELAHHNGLLHGERARRLERVISRLPEWIDEHDLRPSLLHGDLWSGNWMLGPGGAPVLIDPAVSYGDREADIAFTTLFGRFPEPFYRAYAEAWPLRAGWRERRDLYNLYHLLNHMNIFGESYGRSVDAVLQRYA